MAGHPKHIAVLGGGLAGLSLVVQLLDRRVDARITVVEPRTAYGDDRTWCFWDTDDHPFRHLIRDRWWAWRVSSASGVRACRSGTYAYARLAAGDVYAYTLDRLRAAGNVQLWTGTHVRRLDGRRVVTDRGTLDADVVYDGRPPNLPANPEGPRLLQQFVGRRVRLSEPTLDPGTCDLMDFRVPQHDGIAFLYVLPSKADMALVEATVFAGHKVPDARLDALLDDALAERFGANVVTLGQERGAIPMQPGLGTDANPPGVIPIGTRAGAPRGSTGYAFLPIQRHSRALADRLAVGDPGPVAMRGWTTQWLDRVFLNRLVRRPDLAPGDFDRLFARVAPERLVRFLMERGGPVDHLAVMSALPTGPFLREAAAVSVPGLSPAAPRPAPPADPDPIQRA
jgi:lycopene beta-cyclase